MKAWSGRIPVKKFGFDITQLKGHKILPTLKELVNGATWFKGSEFDFYVFSNSASNWPRSLATKPVFSVWPQYYPSKKPGNGFVKFPRFPSTWKEDLQPVLKPGFGLIYKKLQKETFLANQKLLKKREFGCFILLQFEIARRVPNDPAGFPSADQVRKGIKIARHFDDEKTYEILTDMFCSSLECRMHAFEMLKKEFDGLRVK